MKLFAVMDREVRAYLGQFSFYLMVAFFLGISGYFFWSDVMSFGWYSGEVSANPRGIDPTTFNLTDGVFVPYLVNASVFLLLLIPVLTMRSFSEERKTGTLELLFTYPVRDLDIVLGKYLSILFLVAVLIFPTLIYYPIGIAVGARFETTTLLTGYLGLFLMGASFAALGLFVSTLTDNQTVSAGICFVLILFFWVVGWAAEWAMPSVGVVFRELSLVDHFRDFSQGIVDTKDLMFFALFILFFLFSTLSVLEVRNWKR